MGEKQKQSNKKKKEREKEIYDIIIKTKEEREIARMRVAERRPLLRLRLD